MTIESENAELRQIISELGYCTPNASLDFMRLIPAEVRAVRADLALLRPSAYTKSLVVPASMPEFLGEIARFEADYDLREYIDGLAENPGDGIIWRDLMDVACALAAATRRAKTPKGNAQ